MWKGPVIDGCTCNCGTLLLRPPQTQSHAALCSSDGGRCRFQRSENTSPLPRCHRGCGCNKTNLGERTHPNGGAFTPKVTFLPRRGGVNLKTNGGTSFFNGFSHTCVVLTHVMLLRVRRIQGSQFSINKAIGEGGEGGVYKLNCLEIVLG